jgi:hypothetical protein
VNAIRSLSLSLAVPLLTGCFASLFYSGDGTFQDNGILSYSRRYVIDLGPIDLSSPHTYTYHLSGLPHDAELNVAIEAFEATRNEWDVRPPHPAVVRLSLNTESGEVVILEQGALDSWVRGYGVLDNVSDLYLRGESRDIPLPGGGTRGEELGVKASGGWGTYFNSEPGAEYVLRLEVLSSGHETPAHLVLHGWDRVDD